MQSNDMAASIFAAASRSALHALYANWREEFTDQELIDDCERLKTEQFDVLLHNDSRKARHLALALTMLGRDVGITPIIALGLLAQADAMRQAGKSLRAMALFDRSAATFRAAGLPIGWARARGGWAVAASDADMATDADLAAMEEVYGVLREANEQFRLANVQQNVALAYHYIGNFPAAFSMWDEALATLGQPSTFRERNLQAMILANQALTRLWQGELDASFTLHSETRRLFQDVNEQGRAALEILKLSIVEQERGHLAEALRLSTLAYEDLKRREHRNTATLALLHRAKILIKLNRLEEAVESTSEATSELSRQQSVHDLIDALCTKAQALARSGDGPAALKCLKEAEEKAGGRSHPHAFRIALERAALFLQLGQAAEAHAIALDVAERSRAHNVLIHQRMGLLLAAESTLALNQLDEARTQAEQLLELGRDTIGAELSYRCELLLARIAHQRGQNTKALEYYDSVVAILSSFVQELAYDRRTDFLEDKDAFYMEALTVALDANDPVKAFIYLEQQRARSTWLVTSGNDADLERLRTRHRALSASLLASPAEPRAAEVARRELRKLAGQITERIAAMATKIRSQSAVDVAGILAAIPPQSAVVAYALTPREMAIFVLAGGRIDCVRVQGALEELETLDRHLRQRRESFARQVAGSTGVSVEWEQAALNAVKHSLHGLWNILIAPVEPLLPPDGGSLIFVPHGQLHQQSLSGLYDGARYVTERWVVNWLPSCQVLLQLAIGDQDIVASASRNTLPIDVTSAADLRSLLALGYASDEHDLPQVTSEVEVIAALTGGTAVTGKRATGSLLRERAAAHAYLHLAAHGAARRDVPNSSFVELADGLFHPVDALALSLQTCQLVVLSACETGLGKARGGDDQLGLVRAFGLAGAHAILATLWRVNDDASRVFMENFYKWLAAGETPAEALRATQQAFISGAAGSIHRHPYYWAGFRLVIHRPSNQHRLDYRDRMVHAER
ncbi:MAG: CHAT domain-containing protein [Ktedonobacterales bacterium]